MIMNMIMNIRMTTMMIIIEIKWHEELSYWMVFPHSLPRISFEMFLDGDVSVTDVIQDDVNPRL